MVGIYSYEPTLCFLVLKNSVFIYKSKYNSYENKLRSFLYEPILLYIKISILLKSKILHPDGTVLIKDNILSLELNMFISCIPDGKFSIL